MRGARTLALFKTQLVCRSTRSIVFGNLVSRAAKPPQPKNTNPVNGKLSWKYNRSALIQIDISGGTLVGLNTSDKDLPYARIDLSCLVPSPFKSESKTTFVVGDTSNIGKVSKFLG